MERSLKNIRKVSNIRVFVISDDTTTKESIKKEFGSKFKDIKLISSNDEINSKSISSSDIIIVDLDIQKGIFEELTSKIQSVASFIPKIVISSEDSEDKIFDAVNIQAYTFLLKPLDLINLKLSIVMCINQTKRSDKIELSHGIYFDEYRDQFFKKGGAIIDFTRLEKSFLKLLISRKDEITDYDMIKDVVWKGKEMSIYTMRNIVNKIRQKTYYEIIKNHSGRGYTIDIIKN
ncbi:response regulator [Aliarcobacter lanthieri]|uniref:response regulator n=1 Tax=Aliarcobacter lanthieri TaxID=1355374 RepID=UPI00047C0F0B|nr:response regulator [Aliarcobacter lanthieri]QKF59455.1 signal transduction response regulator [Aliarcobacter lanthieri]